MLNKRARLGLLASSTITMLMSTSALMTVMAVSRPYARPFFLDDIRYDLLVWALIYLSALAANLVLGLRIRLALRALGGESA